MRTAEVIAFVREREAIRVRKGLLVDGVEGVPSYEVANAWRGADWTLDRLTDDPILAKFRFCNVRRQDDRVTRWIVENIINPYADHEYLWLVLCIARVINWPPTLHWLKCYPNAWPRDDMFKPSILAEALDEWKKRGNKTYTGAYMIRAPSSPSEPWFTWSKQRYIGEIVIGKLWEARGDWIYVHAGDTRMEDAHSWLKQFTGWGDFMVYQAVVDMSYCRYFQDAPDKQTWAAAGPGTLRGLNRRRGEHPTAKLSQSDALGLLCELRERLNQPGAIWPWLQPLDLSNVANICCEYDKYQRVKLCEGRPRALYVPGRGS